MMCQGRLAQRESVCFVILRSEFDSVKKQQIGGRYFALVAIKRAISFFHVYKFVDHSSYWIKYEADFTLYPLSKRDM